MQWGERIHRLESPGMKFRGEAVHSMFQELKKVYLSSESGAR